jgi:hypothetical protein
MPEERPQTDIRGFRAEWVFVTDTVEKVFFGRSSKNLRAVQAWQQFSADRVAGFSLSRSQLRLDALRPRGAKLV